jgi:hypothetical protein
MKPFGEEIANAAHWNRDEAAHQGSSTTYGIDVTV